MAGDLSALPQTRGSTSQRKALLNQPKKKREYHIRGGY